MVATDQAVLADVLLLLVEREDHLVRRVGDEWICVRPRHRGDPCSTEFTTRR
ncbi:hypothetical protein [Actinoallomurus acaciae]|uniref:Uncharacterized protein n=1 Tax=Actinoallomurus acaciae TaxID=502577 RepID=A0ABV5YR06_9ACTN